jgi:fucose permease
MSPLKPKRRLYLITSTFLAMLIMAITDSTKGILVPTFKDTFNVTDTSIGTFLLIGSLVYMFTTYHGSKVCDHIGQKKSIVIGMAIAGIGYLMTSFSQVFLHLILGYIVITVGIALMTIGMNTVIPLLKVSYIGLLMNWLHLFYGIGSTLTQKVTGYLLYAGISWRTVFIGYFVLYALGIIIYLFVEQPEESHEEKMAKKNPIPHKGLLFVSCMALGFYVAGELQTSNWMLNYLQEVKGFNTNEGATYVALFFGIFSVGRLLGGFVLDRIGYMKSIIISTGLAFVLYTSGLLLGGKALYLVSFSGLFFAITFPTFVTVMQKAYPKNATRVTAIIATSGSGVAMIVSYLIGALNDIIGPGITFYIIPLSVFISLILMVGIYRKLLQMQHHEGLTMDIKL